MPRQPKQVPDRRADDQFWIDLVTHPEKNVSGHSHFENASDPDNRFDPSPGQLSRKNAWWLAEASFLAYFDDDKAKAVYSGLALNCICLSNESTQCHLVFDERFAFVAFRGTQSGQWDDIFLDARFGLDDWKNGRVHQGFKKGFLDIQDQLQKAIGQHARNLPLWLTGHSLGAALATLAADVSTGVEGVYTFGNPRVGDQTFADHFDQTFARRSFRYVDDHDVVTHLPPETLPFFFSGKYVHVDEQRWIDHAGNVGAATPAVPHFVQDVFGGGTSLFGLMQFLTKGMHLLDGKDLSKGSLVPDALKDHAPVLYAIHTWNDLVKNP